MKTKKRMYLIVLCFMMLLIAPSTGTFAASKKSRLYKQDAAAFRKCMKKLIKKGDYYEAMYAIADINGDKRKDVIISNIAQGAGGYDTPRKSQILMKKGKKLISRTVTGNILKAGVNSFQISSSILTYTDAWAEGKGRGSQSTDQLYKVNKAGKVSRSVSKIISNEYEDGPYTTVYKNAAGKKIKAAAYKKILKKAKLKTLHRYSLSNLSPLK